MSFSKITAVAAAAALISQVAAHGRVQGVSADGVYYEGYNPSFQYESTAPVVVGWSDPDDLSNGFIAPDAYATADIICHTNASNAQTYANVTAGSEVTLMWTEWPSSHHGPVIDYLASCDGDCTTVDKTSLEFFKIDGVGLIDDSTVPGTWATDQLIANNNSWAVTIPSTLAPGGYVLRHEIIALHSAGNADGAQNYPQCINLWVSGSGTATPATADTTKGEALYTETEAGIEINIYTSLSTYTVPGPTQWASATASVSQGGASSAVASSASSVASSVASTTTSAAAITSSASAASVASSSAPVSTTVAAVIATSASSSSKSNSKVSCTKKSSTSIAVAAVVTSAPTTISHAGGSNVITDEITDYIWTTDIITETVTVGGAKRRHARDVRA